LWIVIVKNERGLAVSEGLLLLLSAIIFHFKDLLTINIHVLEIVASQNRIELLSKLHIGLSGLWIMILSLLTLSILLEDTCCIE
jgi:hypothetical protein